MEGVALFYYPRLEVKLRGSMFELRQFKDDH